jgi:glucosamine 6-phosphate synthetase-like amidotransferase/phosphosugar isomerase protein
MSTIVSKIDQIKIPIPIFGVGCGVLGLSVVKVTPKLGEYASNLLKSLEYRGYDSTGALFQDEENNTVLLKDVGAPSTLIETLGINKQLGKIFCGQVRWATFGAVTKVNAQPHEVRCKIHLYGAHNGNITNTAKLKSFLTSQGHKVLSDNDGEMLVHTVEHYFDIELQKQPVNMREDYETRSISMRKAIIKAAKDMIGSYAAVIVDPVTELSYGIKAGSSLYFGIGTLEGDNSFSLVSSDLTAILKFTKHLVDLKEGTFVEFGPGTYKIFAYKDLTFKKLNRPDLHYAEGQQIDTNPVRSKLRIEDTELLPQFEYFMEQEIYSEAETVGRLIKIIVGGSNTGKRMIAFLEKNDMLKDFQELTNNIMSEENYDKQQAIFNQFTDSERADEYMDRVKVDYPAIYDELVKEEFEKKYFFSSEKNLFIDLIDRQFDKKRILVSKALDSVTELADHQSFETQIKEFTKLVGETLSNSRNIYTLACGTSFHATKIAAMFFNEIAGIEIIPVLPGEFRGQYSKCLQDKDVIIGVSQSGETKDLIDIFNDIDRMNIDIKKIVLVNNINSTLGQEKSDISIPIYCGQEIAVPATKSFVNQIALFYYLAIRTAEMKKQLVDEGVLKVGAADLTKVEFEKYYKFFRDIPMLIKETIETTKDQISYVASKIYMEPSIHILATRLVGVAKEGALKVRETLLNHTEGQEASEFKHGPNTILGKNTILGLKNIKAMVKYTSRVSDDVEKLGVDRNIPYESRREVVKALMNYIFDKTFPFHLSKDATQLFKDVAKDYNIFDPIYRNYPLVYITGPEERDVNLTISQINTHKIRGADTFVIAEENDNLMHNAQTNPYADDSYYGHGYITLPKTGDTMMTTFSATVVLQLLALQMSIRKMRYLDKLGMIEHGVHPDVPKNVSKSITVD